MKLWLVIISVGLMIFLAGCIKEKPTEVQFRNDVITIGNYVVDNVAPYAGQDVTISFDIKNNGDRPIKWVKVNFFDTPGFEIIRDCLDGYNQKSDLDICVCIDSTKCELQSEKTKGSLECTRFGEVISHPNYEQNCTFGDPKALPTILDVIEPLDTRSVKFTMRVAKDINSPTPFTISFAITYRYGSIEKARTYFFSGERTSLIPVIDPNFKKAPSLKFSQSEPTIGPIVFDIIPSLEREKVVDGKSVKEYWGVVGTSFQTKFIMKKVVSEGALKDIPAELYVRREPTIDCKTNLDSCIEFQLTNLQISSAGRCDFAKVKNKESFVVNGTIVNEKNNTLVCTFTPTKQEGFTSEFTSMITIQYNYDYEIVRKQNFVVYPVMP